MWFDDKYKEFFYTREPTARYLDMGNITQQLEMKKRLKCKSFDWFMKEIAYDVLDKYPELPPNVQWGEVSWFSQSINCNQSANQIKIRLIQLTSLFDLKRCLFIWKTYILWYE